MLPPGTLKQSETPTSERKPRRSRRGGCHNPIGAALAAVLFGGLDMLQVQFQTAGIAVSGRIMGLAPYVGVIVVLAVWGKTRMPAAVGDPYETEE